MCTIDSLLIVKKTANGHFFTELKYIEESIIFMYIFVRMNKGTIKVYFHLYFRGFIQNILPESHKKPFLIYAYSDFCLECVRVEHIWQQIVQDLETTG